MSRSEQKKRLFHDLAIELNKVRPDAADTVCCPLCLNDFRFDAMNKLSVEHVISSKVGGYTTTLTCIACNNSQGTKLDRNLVSAFKAMDGLEGTAPIKTEWCGSAGRVVANTFWLSGTKDAPITSRVVGAASNPLAVQGIQTHLRQRSSINLTFNFDFIPEQYWRAAVRAAYLAVFRAQGYEYVFSEGGRQARNVIDGTIPLFRRS